jgi:hypothetical protein
MATERAYVAYVELGVLSVWFSTMYLPHEN